MLPSEHDARERIPPELICSKKKGCAGRGIGCRYDFRLAERRDQRCENDHQKASPDDEEPEHGRERCRTKRRHQR